MIKENSEFKYKKFAIDNVFDILLEDKKNLIGHCHIILTPQRPQDATFLCHSSSPYVVGRNCRVNLIFRPELKVTCDAVHFYVAGSEGLFLLFFVPCVSSFLTLFLKLLRFHNLS